MFDAPLIFDNNGRPKVSSGKFLKSTSRGGNHLDRCGVNFNPPYVTPKVNGYPFWNFGQHQASRLTVHSCYTHTHTTKSPHIDMMVEGYIHEIDQLFYFIFQHCFVDFDLCISVPTSSWFLHSCKGLDAYWCMCKCCTTYCTFSLYCRLQPLYC